MSVKKGWNATYLRQIMRICLRPLPDLYKKKKKLKEQTLHIMLKKFKEI